ncbi:MAG: DUF885 domain-containing protein [Bryobacterales bacterium]|nr:DUF885 domain-containing protein [Bryobacterales bacterium]
MQKLIPVFLVLGLLSISSSSSCRRKSAEGEFEKFTSQFVYSTLAMSPITATSVGYHEHQGVHLDEQLDDMSAVGLQRQRQYFASIRDQLMELGKKPLTGEERADFDIMQDLVSLNLLDLDTIQSYKHNPTLYVEMVGNALFSPYVLDYALKEQRMKQIIARLEKIPRFMEEAKSQLSDAPEVWNRVAREENEGNIELIDKTLREEAVGGLKEPYEKAAGPALAALKGFNQWLEGSLSKHTSVWTLGKGVYASKFRYALGTDATPEGLLHDAESFLEATRRQMLALSKPLYARYYPGAAEGGLNEVVGRTLEKIAENHATAGTYIGDARRDLDETRRFVREKNLLALPVKDNLQLIETPAFMRGIYAVGGFNAAPALQPELGAFYWLTPIPENWPKERVESKLREYNTYGLKLLTIHEAMPGHYVQLEYANGVQPLDRRVLRSVFGNGPYVEGWAVYATEMMLDEGYLNNSPELRLTFLKQQLRVAANAILDVRMQTMNMSDEEAMKLMTEDTFQEKEEAAAKLQRAKLSSAQLPTYYLGYREWMKLRTAWRQRKGAGYGLYEFHDAALKEGAAPLRALGKLMEGK